MNQAPNLLFDEKSDTLSDAAYAEVLVTLPFGDVFDYGIPASLAVKAGSIVQIPFGKRTLYGVVSKLKSTTNTPPPKSSSISMAL